MPMLTVEALIDIKFEVHVGEHLRIGSIASLFFGWIATFILTAYLGWRLVANGLMGYMTTGHSYDR